MEWYKCKAGLDQVFNRAFQNWSGKRKMQRLINQCQADMIVALLGVGMEDQESMFADTDRRVWVESYDKLVKDKVDVYNICMNFMRHLREICPGNLYGSVCASDLRWFIWKNDSIFMRPSSELLFLCGALPSEMDVELLFGPHVDVGEDPEEDER